MKDNTIGIILGWLTIDTDGFGLNGLTENYNFPSKSLQLSGNLLQYSKHDTYYLYNANFKTTVSKCQEAVL